MALARPMAPARPMARPRGCSAGGHASAGRLSGRRPALPWAGGFLSRGAVVFSYVFSLLFFAVALLAASAWNRCGDRVARDALQPVATAVPPRIDGWMLVVGQVTRVVGCRWADPVTAAAAGEPVGIGRRYALASGVLEITYHNGSAESRSRAPPCTRLTFRMAASFRSAN